MIFRSTPTFYRFSYTFSYMFHLCHRFSYQISTFSTTCPVFWWISDLPRQFTQFTQPPVWSPARPRSSPQIREPPPSRTPGRSQQVELWWAKASGKISPKFEVSWDFPNLKLNFIKHLPHQPRSWISSLKNSWFLPQQKGCPLSQDKLSLGPFACECLRMLWSSDRQCWPANYSTIGLLISLSEVAAIRVSITNYQVLDIIIYHLPTYIIQDDQRVDE